MKRNRYLIIFGIIVFFWSCAESDLRLEEEQLVISELNLLAGKLKVSDLLVENGIGNRLLKFVYALSPNKPFVHFEVILDKDGNPEMSYIGMNYGERGKIGYTQAALINEYKDELLFHEFFHVFQYAGKEPT